MRAPPLKLSIPLNALAILALYFIFTAKAQNLACSISSGFDRKPWTHITFRGDGHAVTLSAPSQDDAYKMCKKWIKANGKKPKKRSKS
jgi:hypothetical protein